MCGTNSFRSMFLKVMVASVFLFVIKVRSNVSSAFLVILIFSLG